MSGSRKRAASPLDSEVEEVVRNLVPDDSETAYGNRKSTRNNAHSHLGNDIETLKGKGKGRAILASSNARGKPPLNGSSGNDPIEILEDAEDSNTELAIVEAKHTSRQKTRSSKGEEASRVREQLQRAQDQIKALSIQLEEVLRVRQTEPEKLLEGQQVRYEAQLQAQDRVIQEMTSHLNKREPLMRSGSSSVLDLLTRDAANEEKKAFEADLTRWKNIAHERQEKLDDQRARIKELEDIEQDLKMQLKAEIDRANSFLAKASKVPDSALRSKRTSDDPKQVEVTKFYEDLTNILIPNIKPAKGKYPDKEEWIMTCVYSHAEEGELNSNQSRSLHFSLQLGYDEADGNFTSNDQQLVPTVNYIPLDLEKESQEFVGKLEFLGAPFIFGRDQLPLFLRTIRTNMEEAIREVSMIEREKSH